MVSAFSPAAHAAVTPNAPLTRVSPKGMLPHISTVAAPLIMESNVISNAKSAPTRKPWQAVRERAGTLRQAQGRSTLRRNTGRIIDVDYATLTFPAHTRIASSPESPARALATLSGLPATLRAWT